MPPKRQTLASARSTRAQGTISFSKQGQNRVTKPGVTQRNANKSKKDPAVLDVTPAVAEPNLEEPTTAELAIAEQAASAKAEQDPLDEDALKTEDVLGGRAADSQAGQKTAIGPQAADEAEARKVTDAQIKAYWRKKEQARRAPRVHQEGLTIADKVLREFDMSGQFGPCIGIARLKRWKRANMLGLEPPVEVLAVLLKETDKGHNSVQRAYVDELMSSRFIET